MSMKAFFTRKRIAVTSVLSVAALIFAAGNLTMTESVPGTWDFICSIKGLPYPDEIMQVGDTLYLAVENDTIRVFELHDDCTWAEIESPVPDHGMWSTSFALFNVQEEKLGIVWETDIKPGKEPRSTFYWSTYDGITWSEPELLFQRELYCTLRDALMLENGALLLLWEEPYFYTSEQEGKTIRGSGCDIVYRAYINNNEMEIEWVITPEDLRYCYSRAYFLVNDGTHIWCVFEYKDKESSFYRSWSEDGRTWSTPAPFSAPHSDINHMQITPNGEIGLYDYYFEGGNLILLISTDWETWSEEKIFRRDENVVGGFRFAEGKNRTLQGIIVARDSLLLIQSSQERAREYQETMHMADMCGYLSLLCVILTVLYVLLYMKYAHDNNEL